MEREAAVVERPAHVRRLGVMLATTVFIACGCSEERPLPPPELRLQIFAGAIDYTTVGFPRSVMFIYDYDSLVLRDSICLAEVSVDATVSADGRSVFVATAPASWRNSLWKFDALTKQELWHVRLPDQPLPVEYRGRVRLLDKGRMVMLNRKVFSAETGDTLKSFPDHQVPFGGTQTGTRIAVGTISHGQSYPVHLSGMDLSNDSTWGFYMPHLEGGPNFVRTWSAELHHDGRMVLALGQAARPPFNWFVIGDLGTGETLLEQSLGSIVGEIALLANGRFALISDVDRTGTIDMYDLSTFEHLKHVTTELQMRVGQIVVVDDRLELVTSTDGLGSSVGHISVWDGQSLNLLRSTQLPNESERFAFSMGGLAAGCSPMH